MAPTKRTRMSDIAETAGVSTATVSRVLSGKPGVKEETRRAVLEAMTALGYARETPNGKRGGVVAVVVPELSNPAFPAFVEELDILLFAAGQANVVCPAGNSGTGELQHLETLQGLNVSGVVSVSGTPADSLGSNEHYRRLIESGVPTVFINGFAPDLRGAFFSCSDAEAVSASVTHLRTLGHERIGLAIGSERYLPARRKAEGFEALGFPRESIASTIFTVEGGQLAASRLIESGHTAIICGSDIMALGVIREAHSRGLSVPGDLSVVGFDDSPLMAFTEPALTTIRQPVRAMCEAAVTALLEGLGGSPLDRSELLFHPDLIIRNSTGPVA